jgi:hypothetical protein
MESNLRDAKREKSNPNPPNRDFMVVSSAIRDSKAEIVAGI